MLIVNKMYFKDSHTDVLKIQPAYTKHPLSQGISWVTSVNAVDRRKTKASFFPFKDLPL